ncbi:RNA methyltransferase [Candidatus Saganbacteria bacterium]|nr:RNA methyltransferase [Candidatus Saganbacteria bacterium]
MKLSREAKLILALNQNRRTREEEGFFVVEGEKSIKEGLDMAKFILYSAEFEILQDAAKRKIKTIKVSSEAMKTISTVETPPGIIAAAKIKKWKLSDIITKKDPVILVLVGIQDPGNLGTLIRAVDAANAAGIIVSKGTVDPFNPKVVRGTMGSFFRVPVVRSSDIKSELAFLKNKKFRLVGTSLDSKDAHWDADLKGPIAIIIGNESSGLPEEIIDMCDEKVKIPILGNAESLNAAMAGTVLIYESLRQRMKNA